MVEQRLRSKRGQTRLLGLAGTVRFRPDPVAWPRRNLQVPARPMVMVMILVMVPLASTDFGGGLAPARPVNGSPATSYSPGPSPAKYLRPPAS